MSYILSSENLNALDNGPVHQKVNFKPWMTDNLQVIMWELA